MNVRSRNVKDRFLTYVGFDTQSDINSGKVPSIPRQPRLAGYLVDELKKLGVGDVEADRYGCVYGHIPPPNGCARPDLALIVHMDTTMDMSGVNIELHTVSDYNGGDIILNQEKNIATRVSEYPVLERFVGQNLIVTDGTILLGVDDKTGVAEIMTLMQFLAEHPQHPHPGLNVLFTPNKEIDRGADHVNIKKLDAAYGYTVDGRLLGEFSYENFNTANAFVTVHGITAHTGCARGVPKSAILTAMEYQSLLPVYETPGCMEGHEGFCHLDRLEGRTETAKVKFLIRDHDHGKFLRRQELVEEVYRYLNNKYGQSTVEIQIQKNYPSMYEKMKDHKGLISHISEAMEKAQVTPIVNPICGGIGGSRLSYMGLPYPNLRTGGQNGHGYHEFVSVQPMEKVVEILRCLMELYGQPFL